MAVFYARAFGPYQRSSALAWHLISEWLERNNARSRVRQALGLLRDNPQLTAPGIVRYDACVPVTIGLDVDPEVGICRQTLRGGAYAVHTHVGSYDETGAHFSRLHSGIVPRRGLSVDYDRGFLAIYLNDPRYTRPMHRRTELCVPVLPLPGQVPDNDAADASCAISSIRAVAGSHVK
jgi:AraC family transcriptional regulator